MGITVLSGEDTYLLQHRLQQFRADWIATLSDVNLQSLLHKKLSAPKPDLLADTLLEQGFSLGGAPLLEVHQFGPFKEAIVKDATRETLQQALSQTNKTVLFVTPKLDKKLKWVKWLLSQSFVAHQAYDPLAFWETDKAVERLVQLAREKRMTVSPAVAHQLVDAYGMDFFALSQALEQAYVFARGEALTPQHIRAFLPVGDNVFEALTDWIKQAQPATSRWQVFNSMLETEAPHRLLSLTLKQLNDYWLVKTLTQVGQSAAAIAPLVGKKPGWINVVWKWLQYVPIERLQTLRTQAVETDWAIKSGRLHARLALELLWAM